MSKNIDNIIELPDSRDDVLIDYALGDLSLEEAKALEKRMAEDGLLRVEYYEHRKLIESLRARRSSPPAANITSSVMAQIRQSREVIVVPEEKVIPFPYRRWVAAVAALLLLFAGVFISIKNRLPSSVPSVASLPDAPSVLPATAIATPMVVAVPEKVLDEVVLTNLVTPQNEDVAWLKSAQLPDGSWDAAQWGGTWRARPGLTALVLCGLIKAEPENVFAGPNAETATRALNYLLASARDPSVNNRSAVVHQQQVLFVGIALHEARRLCRDDQTIQRIDEALMNLRIQNTADSLSIASSMIRHLPEEASAKGGRIYLVARSMLIDS